MALLTALVRMSNKVHSRLMTHLLFTKNFNKISEATLDYEKSISKIKVNGNPLVAFFCLILYLSPKIHIQILQTDLHTVVLRIAETIWFKIKAFSLW